MEAEGEEEGKKVALEYSLPGKIDVVLVPVFVSKLHPPKNREWKMASIWIESIKITLHI